MTTRRLVATFPLNGDQYEGFLVHIIDEGTVDERFTITDLTHGLYGVLTRNTFVEAVALCLHNNGWGDYTITDNNS